MPEDILKKIANEIREDVIHIATAIPENNYWILSAYMLLLPHITKEISKASLPISTDLTSVFNYIDGGCSFIVGACQINDDESHRVLTTRIKGWCNLMNGAQLITVSALISSGVAGTALGLGPIAFAAGAGVGFALSLIDWARAIRRTQDPEFWLQDSESEVTKITGVCSKLTEQIQQMEEYINALQTAKKNPPKLAKWALERKKTRHQQLLKRSQELERGINELKQQQPLKFTDNINKLCNKECREASANTVIFGLAFVGMILFCIPGLQIPAIAIISAVSALFLLRYAPYAIKSIAETANYAFGSTPQHNP